MAAWVSSSAPVRGRPGRARRVLVGGRGLFVTAAVGVADLGGAVGVVGGLAVVVDDARPVGVLVQDRPVGRVVADPQVEAGVGQADAGVGGAADDGRQGEVGIDRGGLHEVRRGLVAGAGGVARTRRGRSHRRCWPRCRRCGRSAGRRPAAEEGVVDRRVLVELGVVLRRVAEGGVEAGVGQADAGVEHATGLGQHDQPGADGEVERPGSAWWRRRCRSPPRRRCRRTRRRRRCSWPCRRWPR